MSRVQVNKVLVVASGGGHWIQVLRMVPALAGGEIVYVTTMDGCQAKVAPARCHIINDASLWNKPGLVMMALRLAWIILRERPDVIISTGAAPGFFALRIGRILGAKTIWVDSIANVEELSLSGQKVGPHADLWLTQWPHLARSDGPYFAGAVL